MSRRRPDQEQLPAGPGHAGHTGRGPGRGSPPSSRIATRRRRGTLGLWTACSVCARSGWPEPPAASPGLGHAHVAFVHRGHGPDHGRGNPVGPARSQLPDAAPRSGRHGGARPASGLPLDHRPATWQPGPIATQVDLVSSSPTLADGPQLGLSVVKITPPGAAVPDRRGHPRGRSCRPPPTLCCRSCSPTGLGRRAPCVRAPSADAAADRSGADHQNGRPRSWRPGRSASPR